MPSAPSIDLDVSPSRRLLPGLLVTGAVLAIGSLMVCDVPWFVSLPLLLLLVGVELRAFTKVLHRRHMVLFPIGYWVLDGDPRLWRLTRTDRFPGLIRLRFEVMGSPDKPATLLIFRDQLDRPSWRLLDAWTQSPASTAAVA